jgi:hypothetical protein
VRSAILIVAFALASFAQNIVIVPAPVSGLNLIGSQSPEFQATLAAVVGSDFSTQLTNWLPLAVVVKNNTSRTVVACNFVWSFDGIARGGGFAVSLESPKGSANRLQPGASVVALPTDILTQPPGPALQTAILGKQSRNLTGLLSGLDRGQTLTIFLDYVIFDDGQFVGPDVRNAFAREAAAFSAWRAVDQSVQSQLAVGESFDSVAASLSAAAAQWPAAAQTNNWNAETQATEARQLLKFYERNGGPALSGLIQQELALPVVVVHR